MIIIAEKINGSIPSMSKAIAEHNEEWILDVARKQDEVLSDQDFIDCCSSVDENEVETMEWMINLIQSVSDKKIAVDSPNPQVCLDCMKFCKRPGMINSATTPVSPRPLKTVSEYSTTSWQRLSSTA